MSVNQPVFSVQVLLLELGTELFLASVFAVDQLQYFAFNYGQCF